MRDISVADLGENLYFDAPVFLDPGYILLCPDTRTTPELISRLRRWGYKNVHSDGQPREPPVYASSPEKQAPLLEAGIKEQQNLEEAKRQYFKTSNFLMESFERFRDGNRLDLQGFAEHVKALIQMVKGQKDFLLRTGEFPFVAGNYLYRHSVEAGIVALAVGDTLRLPPHRLIDLGIGALLHDIGMMKIPERLYLAAQRPGPKEWQMIKAHTVLGYRILKGFSLSDEVALAALEHHERLDGSGYPRGLAGEKITMNARIVALACSYEAMINKRSFKSAKDAHQAVLELLRQRRSQYDENCVRALVVCLSLYPPGTLVELSNGAVGRVIRTNPQSPKEPIVQLLRGEDGQAVEEQQLVQPGEDSGLTVVRGLPSREAHALGIA